MLSTPKSYGHFERTYLQVSDNHAPIKDKTIRANHAPIKNKTIRANHAPYMSKALRKAIMRRSMFESKYLKNRNSENKEVYRKQKNYCSRLYKKERKKYYAKLDLKNITENNKFWRTVKPF